MKKTTVLLAFLGLSCLLASTVSAESRLTGASSPTGVSGIGGTNKPLSKPAADNDVLFGVEIAERSDDPCFLKARFRDAGTGAEAGSLRFAGCSDNNNNEGTNSSRKTVLLSKGFFVNAVRICLNSDRDKLKGIQLLGTYEDCILGEETVTVLPSDSSGVVSIGGHEYNLSNDTSPREIRCDEVSVSNFVERTNCKGSGRGPDQDWESKVSCPQGMVATGVKLSTRESGGGRSMIDGVALDCTRLVAE